MNLTTLLKLLAFAVLSGSFLKAVIDIDGSWDTWMYHLPFAARLWGITTPDDYVMHFVFEERFQGFPLLAEYLQGFFWWLFQRPEMANLVGFLSLLIYVIYLNRYLRIPLYLGTLLLFAIPIVQIHAVSCYIDLFGNVAAAILIIHTFLCYTRKDFLTPLNVLIIVIAAASAVNSRFVLTPLAFLLLSLIILRVLWFGWRAKQLGTLKLYQVILFFPALFLILSLVFATPLKNVIVYGNPVYPMKMSIAGMTLNYKHTVEEVAPPYLKDAPRMQRWLHSILEVETYPFTHPLHWSVDQYFPPHFGNRLGGYFAAYVIFNLILFGYLLYRLRTSEAKIMGLSFLALTVLTANMPQSLELRYYLYWMLILVACNAYLVLQLRESATRWINAQMLGGVAATATVVVVLVTRGMYVFPSFFTVTDLHREQVDPQIIQTLHAEKPKACFYRTPWILLYAPVFNPPNNYSIKEGATAEECGADYQFKPEWRQKIADELS